MKLIIANKNYSSWSMRPWLLLSHLGIPFEEEKLSFNDPEFKRKVGRYSPVGKVPVLVDGDLAVWDSLAIIEYVADKFPDKKVWPQDRSARARARSICAEIHSGFPAIREHLSMNCELRMSGVWNRAVQTEVARIFSMWREALEKYKGPFLFGDFSAADAFYAPVTRRFVSYGIDMPDYARAYVEHIGNLPAMKAWLAEGLAEHDYFAEDEPYRFRR